MLLAGLLLPPTAVAQKKAITHCHYWFDQSRKCETTTAYNGSDTLRLSLDTKSLPMGVHSLYYRFRDSEGLWGSLHSSMFFVRALPKNGELKAEKVEYWTDSDINNRKSITLNGDEASFAIDASAMRDGLHTFYYRLKDSEGMYSPLSTWLFTKASLPDSTRRVLEGEYWVDGSYDSRKTVGVADGQMSFTLNAASLSEGLHTLNYRMKDSHGLYTPLQTWMFLRNELRDTALVNGITNIDYWFDDLKSLHSVKVSGDTILVAADASPLSEGLHTLCFRIKDKKGLMSSTQSWLFMKAALPDSTRKVTEGEYWVDGSYDSRKTVGVADGQMSFTLNAASLSEGLHTLNYRMKDSHGLYTPLQTWMFLRNELRDTTLVNGVKDIEYWFDDDVATLRSVKATGDTIQFSADASKLREGLHKLSYRAKDALGKYSTPVVWAFYKKSAQQTATKIAWYRYWWNNHEDKAVKETVKEDSSAFVLEKQLTVPDYAKTDGFSSNATARFNILFGDDLGHTSPLQAFDVSYPDEQPPVTTIEADKEEATGSVVLTWKANESQIEDYNIYYAEGNQPFVLWLPNTTKTTATFKGQAGKTYRFTVTARDKAGNRETYNESKYAKVTFTN